MKNRFCNKAQRCLSGRCGIAGWLLIGWLGITGWVYASGHDRDWTVTGHGGLTVQAQVIGDHVRIQFENPRGQGYILVRKVFRRALPERYRLQYTRRADPGLETDVEFRLIDPPGRSVWWVRDYASQLGSASTLIAMPSAALEYAWGPATSGLQRSGSAEWVLTPLQAGRGTVEIGALRLDALPRLAGPDRPVSIAASSAVSEHPPQQVLDGRLETSWESAGGDPNATLTLDLGGLRALGGLWLAGCTDRPAKAELWASDDARQWRPWKRSLRVSDRRFPVYLPTSEARFVQLRLSGADRDQAYCLREWSMMPATGSGHPNGFLAAVAQASPEGHYPQYLLGQQSYFTVFGSPAGGHPALLDEEGRVEFDRGGFSVEPFVYYRDQWLSWRQVTREPRQVVPGVPVPSVAWARDGLRLEVTGYKDPARSTPRVRYRISHHGEHAEPIRLLLAIRPMQVNPPWQSLNMIGGFSPIRRLEWSKGMVLVNQAQALIPSMPPATFGVQPFDQGDLVEELKAGRLPTEVVGEDALGFLSGALSWSWQLPPNGEQTLEIEQLAAAESPPPAPRAAAVRGDAQDPLARALVDWQQQLPSDLFIGPAAAQPLIDTVRANLGFILINRDPPALQPGPRTYARAWIRDGAVMSSALLSLGHARPAREFIEWYAHYQNADGSLPCCVDRRGADPLAEHDSHGEYLYSIAEYVRYTRDLDWLRRQWPSALRAVAAIKRLRESQMTAAYRSGKRSAFYGLMPASISHEGYAGHPVHAFWDDFWTLRGLKDAVWLAEMLGDRAQAPRLVRLRDAFRASLYRAVHWTLQHRQVAYFPASVELGDFDVNATAAIINLAGEGGSLPMAAIDRTFDEYGDYVRKRQAGEVAWDAYTPYELRSVEALVRLGRREQAWRLLDVLLAGQRPSAWRQWAEVVWKQPAAPKFIGDMPHAWIGAESIRAIRALFAYEREEDASLVLAAGIPEVWLATGEPIGVTRLPTPYGALTYRLRQVGTDTWQLHIEGSETVPGGWRIALPPERTLRSLEVNGRPSQAFTAHEARVERVPAEVTLRF